MIRALPIHQVSIFEKRFVADGGEIAAGILQAERAGPRFAVTVEEFDAGLVAAVSEDGADGAVGLDLGVAVAGLAEFEAHIAHEAGGAVPFALHVGAALAEIEADALGRVGCGRGRFVGVTGDNLVVDDNSVVVNEDSEQGLSMLMWCPPW